jgi:hypothetical protein
MAYFSNGSEGVVFDDECASCKYGKHPCPIAWVQTNYNYDQLKDKTGTAEKILNDLVSKNGTCKMKETFKYDLLIDPNQLNLDI